MSLSPLEPEASASAGTPTRFLHSPMWQRPHVTSLPYPSPLPPSEGPRVPLELLVLSLNSASHQVKYLVLAFIKQQPARPGTEAQSSALGLSSPQPSQSSPRGPRTNIWLPIPGVPSFLLAFLKFLVAIPRPGWSPTSNPKVLSGTSTQSWDFKNLGTFARKQSIARGILVPHPQREKKKKKAYN